MAFIIGTAGHIDHGKTSLVKALTGQDTDRLKEEKARGISIDLGFAYLDLPNGDRAGVVDVPGHERFVRNMLAGAHGIDLALFTVAADDGVMPQTEEHLQIVRHLGIERAIFVLTKIDLVTDERARAVEEEIEILVAGSTLEGSPTVRCSVVSGEGVDAVRQTIAGTLATFDKRPPPGLFRLPVDRVFTLHGHGLVVTGTARSGTVRVGDQVRVLPGSTRVRVRGLHVHGRAVDEARWGQRVALNISGADAGTLARGHVIADERLDAVSDRFDARIDVAFPKDIRRRLRVRLHVGTAERMAGLEWLSDVPAGGDDAHTRHAQLSLREPVQLMRGDRFVLRDESAQRTIGGGMVLDPWPKRWRRRDTTRRAWLAVLDSGLAPEVVQAFVNTREEFATPAERVRDFMNLDAGEVLHLTTDINGLRSLVVDEERLLTTDEKWRRLEDDLTAALGSFHTNRPLEPGMDVEALRAAVSFPGTPRLFRAVVDHLASAGVVIRDANFVRLPGHVVRMQGEDQRLAARVVEVLTATPLAPPTTGELESTLGVTRQKLVEVIRVLERDGAIVRIAPDLFLVTTALDQVKAALVAECGDGRPVTPAAFRDRLGTSRKYVIPLLEYCDRTGLTIRRGDVRTANVSKLTASRA
jgi:selenocysteine-specific elongation factor